MTPSVIRPVFEKTGARSSDWTTSGQPYTSLKPTAVSSVEGEGLGEGGVGDGAGGGEVTDVLR